MKNFSVVLNDILTQNQMTQVELGTLSGLGQKKISNLVNDVIRADKDDLQALFTALPLPEQRVQIAMAHIRDEVPEEAFKALQIRANESAMLDERTLGLEHLPPRGQDALRFLLNLQDELPNLSELLIQMAKLVGWTETSPPKPPAGPVKYTNSSPPESKVTELVRETFESGVAQARGEPDPVEVAKPPPRTKVRRPKKLKT